MPGTLPSRAGAGPLPNPPERHQEKEKGNTAPFTAGNQTDEHLRNKNCHTPEHYIRERSQRDGSGKGRLARAQEASCRTQDPPEQDGRLLGDCGNTSLGVLHFTENKTKTIGKQHSGDRGLADIQPGNCRACLPHRHPSVTALHLLLPTRPVLIEHTGHSKQTQAPSKEGQRRGGRTTSGAVSAAASPVLPHGRAAPARDQQQHGCHPAGGKGLDTPCHRAQQKASSPWLQGCPSLPAVLMEFSSHQRLQLWNQAPNQPHTHLARSSSPDQDSAVF